MRITEDRIDNVRVLGIRGAINANGGDRKLRDRVRDLVDHRCHDLVLDLRHVRHVDAAGVGALVACLGFARRGGGDLKLVNLTGRIRSTVTICGLLRVFEVYDDVDAAVRSFSFAHCDRFGLAVGPPSGVSRPAEAHVRSGASV